MRTLLAPLLLLAACGQSARLVVVNGLAQGEGGMGTSAGAVFDVVIRMENDSTGFAAPDLMRVLVDGVDRTGDVVLGGNFALLRIAPPPVGTRFVELFRRTGPLLDSFTWVVQAYAGPTLAGVSPASAREGDPVTLTGAGFSGGPLRVFFGGVEGAVGASDDATITATVPVGALPGLVWVLVGPDAAEGIVDFQPLDAMDRPIPPPTAPRVFAVFPASGGAETAVRVYGVNFTNFAIPSFNERRSTRVFDVRTVTLPVVGDVTAAFGVVSPRTMPGSGAFRLRQFETDSNDLPFTVN